MLPLILTACAFLAFCAWLIWSGKDEETNDDWHDQ